MGRFWPVPIHDDMMSPSPLSLNDWITPWSPPPSLPPDSNPRTSFARAECSPPPTASFTFPTTSSRNPMIPPGKMYFNAVTNQTILLCINIHQLYIGVHSNGKEGEMGKIIAGKPYRRGMLFAVVVAGVLALAAGSVLAAGALVDINTADQKALESLPGIGPSTAKEIVKGRPYKSVDDLANVKGLGKSKLEKIKPLVTVGGTPAAQHPAAAGAPAGAAA